jgi:hypothetical protein
LASSIFITNTFNLYLFFSGDSDVLNLASSLASDLAQLVETMHLRSESRHQNKNASSSAAGSTASTDSRKGTLVIKSAKPFHATDMRKEKKWHFLNTDRIARCQEARNMSAALKKFT